MGLRTFVRTPIVGAGLLFLILSGNAVAIPWDSSPPMSDEERHAQVMCTGMYRGHSWTLNNWDGLRFGWLVKGGLELNPTKMVADGQCPQFIDVDVDNVRRDTWHSRRSAEFMFSSYNENRDVCFYSNMYPVRLIVGLQKQWFGLGAPVIVDYGARSVLCQIPGQKAEQE